MNASTRPSATRAPLGVLGMLGLVFFCESYLASNDLKFSRIEADDWYHSAKVARGELPSGGVLFFGDSQIKFGVTPLLLESKLGQPAHCLAVQGGQAVSSYLMLKRAIDSGVIPSAIVVDFEPHLNRDGIDHNKRMWSEVVDLGEAIELAWHAGDVDALANILLGKVLPSYRERFEIRGTITSALRGEEPFMPRWLMMTHRNKGMNRGAVAMAKRQDGLPPSVHSWGNPTPKPWAPDPVNDLYAHKFMKLAADHHLPVYCLLMPVAGELLAKYEKVGLDTHYDRWVRSLQSRYSNLFVLDWRRSGYPEGVFGDGIHLNYQGASSVTVALGDHLARAYRGQGLDDRWVRMPPFTTEAVSFPVEDTGRSTALIQTLNSRRR